MRTVEELIRLGPEAISTFSREEVRMCVDAETSSGIFAGELPIGVEIRRQKCLDSPSFLATQVLDPWYERNFEPVHYPLMDEVLAPYLLGETVKIEGITYDPREYRGMMILFSRSTIKSTILRIMAQWVSLYRKIRLKEDARIMFCHQVLEKAIEHSVAVRTCAKEHGLWRETFPDFKAPGGAEWDTKAKWRWPNFSSHMATEFSLVCYGETSSKEGGHYTDRFVDDWVTADSVGNEQMLTQSDSRFTAMDNLRDRSRPYNPWLAMGTHYHFQDAYKKIEQRGGWLVWKMPAHTGSPKRIFEIAAIDDRTDSGRRKKKSALKKLEENPPGKLNFPHLLPWRELVDSARMQGPHEYNCQLLLNPVPEGEQRFDQDALDDAWTGDLPLSEDIYLYMRIDPAISIKKDADETAIVLGAVRWDQHRFLLDGWVGREKRPVEVVRKAFDMCRKWQDNGFHVKNIGVESVSYQEALASIMRDGVPVRAPKFDGESVPMLVKPCPIRSIKRSPDMRKHERILQMDGAIARREFHVWDKCPIGTRAVQQFKNFPFDRFDILDAIHDFWVDTYAPPRSTNPVPSGMPAEFLKIINKKRKGKLGMTNTSNLTGWG